MTISSYNQYSSNFDKELGRIQSKKTESNQSTGAILSKDSLEVPYEKQFTLQTSEASAGRPSLPPLFQMRLAEDHQMKDLIRNYYQMLRNQLSPILKEKLEIDETIVLIDERDPQMTALDANLLFQATLLAYTDSILLKKTDKNNSYSEFQTLVRDELLKYGETIADKVKGYLPSLGKTDPANEIFSSVLRDINSSIQLLKQHQEESK